MYICQFPGRSCLLKILKENGEKKDFDSKVVNKKNAGSCKTFIVQCFIKTYS